MMRISEKLSALSHAASGTEPVSIGSSKYRLNKNTVHARFCSKDKGRSTKFKYNINPNTLTADFELWVCGAATTYYLMPVALMQTIYDDPDSYVDRVHPEIRVVSVDTSSHKVTYARGGKFKLVGQYFNAQFSQLPMPLSPFIPGNRHLSGPKMLS